MPANEELIAMGAVPYPPLLVWQTRRITPGLVRSTVNSYATALADPKVVWPE